jgi:hypothetical protein
MSDPRDEAFGWLRDDGSLDDPFFDQDDFPFDDEDLEFASEDVNPDDVGALYGGMVPRAKWEPTP